jgi:hypothetical protein
VSRSPKSSITISIAVYPSLKVNNITGICQEYKGFLPE